MSTLITPHAPINRRQLLRVAGALSLAGTVPASHAQASFTHWPAKPVRILVAGPVGGSADVVARALGDQLGRTLKQPFVVEPKPGAAGVIAVNDLLQAPNDAYTLLVGVSSLVSEIPHIVKMRYDTRKAITPLAELARGGLVLVAAPNLPVQNLKDVIAQARARADGLSYASYSPGTMSHVAGVLLEQASGAKFVHVGYKGSTPGLGDVMGGHIPLMFDGLATSLPLIRSGKIKAIAISSAQRSTLLPEVPTFQELGYPQLTYTGWMGLWSNSALSAEVQAAVQQQVQAVLNSANYKNILNHAGFEPSSQRDSQTLHKDLLADYERVGKVLAKQPI
ncbi:tripartite tricarboxylate transporter substrate binding protein [Comamonas aquatilis]|uniref:Bug family tripartite tricarboxylate transporter substrate binding protein n=1 Tax=Comamonas aquatilis TaxID=1778406 RepID=UPI0039F0B6AD